MTENLQLQLKGPSAVLPIERSEQAGEGECSPHRQYRIYSNDVSLPIPYPISYPLLHKYYPDIDDNDDDVNAPETHKDTKTYEDTNTNAKSDSKPDPDTKDDNNAFSLPCPSPNADSLPDSSNNDGFHAYQKSQAQSLPLLPCPSCSSVSSPGPLAGSVGESSR